VLPLLLLLLLLLETNTGAELDARGSGWGPAVRFRQRDVE
jgi:hypothetical protein